jgi:hypothetical protein
MTGEKRRPLIIGKYSAPRCSNKKMSNFNYHSNKKAWMTWEIFLDEISKWDSQLRQSGKNIVIG